MSCSCFPSALLISPQEVKGAGDVQSALLGAISPVPDPALAQVTQDNLQGFDGSMLPFPTTLPGTSNELNPDDEVLAGTVGCHEQQPSGDIASSEEEGEAEDNSCELTLKKRQRLADGLMRFSIDLLREVQLESNSTNVILSPLSIALALSHLALGNSSVTKAPFPALPCPLSWRH